MNNNGELNNANSVNTNNVPQPQTDQNPVIVSQEIVNNVTDNGVEEQQQPIPEVAQPAPAPVPGGNVTLQPVNEATNSVIIDQTANVQPQAAAPQQPAPVPAEPQQPLSPKEQKALEKAQAKQAKIDQKNAIAEARAQQAATEQDPNQPQQPKQSSFFRSLLLILVLLLGGYIFYTNKTYQSNINKLKYECTPVTTNQKEEQLPLDSTLVKSLYQKVYTTIKEDVAQPEWNNTMRLYLAYRQIPANEKYESNCNMFIPYKMEPYTCEVKPEFVPLAFKVESLDLAYKKLFGESSTYEIGNIKLEKSCVGGFQYIEERQEFVQGECTTPITTPLKATKKLKEARSYRNTIILVEDVKYTGSDKKEKPEYLKDGTYYYTFRLDVNYNWVFVDRTYNSL